VLRALADSASGVLPALIHRERGPFVLHASTLPPVADGLAATLRAYELESLAALPLLGDATAVGCLLAPAPPGWDPREDEGSWSLVCWSPASLQMAAGNAVLEVLERLGEGTPRQGLSGAVVVDGRERVILADGALRDLPAWRHPDPFGHPLAELPAEPLADAFDAVGPADMGGARVILLAGGWHGREGRPGPWPLSLAARVHAAAGALAAAVGAAPASTDAHVRSLGTLAHGADAARARARAVAGRAGEEAKLVTVDLGAAAAAVLDDLADGLNQSRIRVFSFVAPAPCPIPPDLLVVREVLQALVAGARQALAPSGGTLTVRTWTEAGWACAAVSDDGGAQRGARGAGASAAAAGGSAGMLDEVAAVVESLGGRFQVERRPGVWNRCTLMLPTAGSAVAPSRAGPGRVSREADGALKVLVVDDNAALRSVLRRYLERRGHSVTEATDGDDALRVVGQGESFDRLVVDIHMPGKNGPELFVSLGGVAPHLQGRTLFMTGDLQESATERFLAETGRPSIAKPFDLAEMVRKLEGAA
jgi:CheY-like chemotaxis protein